MQCISELTILVSFMYYNPMFNLGIIQIMAATAAQRDVCYFTFHDQVWIVMESLATVPYRVF